MDFSNHWDDGDIERNLPFVGENLMQYISIVGGWTIEYTKPEPRWFDFFQNTPLKPSAIIIEDEIREDPLSFDDIVNAAQH